MRDLTFVTHVLDLLEPVGPARARAMMGGHMIYCQELPMALIADERLYLKVDAQTKDAFARAGGEPFVYEHSGRSVQMSYWTVPDAALEDPEELRPWALLAIQAAARAKKPAPRKKAHRAASTSAERKKARRPARAARPGRSS